jgi:hypothetical protein
MSKRLRSLNFVFTVASLFQTWRHRNNFAPNPRLQPGQQSEHDERSAAAVRGLQHLRQIRVTARGLIADAGGALARGV